MRPSGLAEVEAAKADGRWDAAYESQKNATVPEVLTVALAASPRAARAFEALGRTRRYGLVLKVLTARTEKGRESQVRRVVEELDAAG
nr:YdeI/OmpD-associated family protein [Myxococcus fulvus]